MIPATDTALARHHAMHGPKLGSYPGLIEEVAIRQGLTKRAVRDVVEDFHATLAKTVWELGRVVVPGLGAFRVRQRKRRRIARPNGERGLMTIAAHQAVTVRVSASWRTHP